MAVVSAVPYFPKQVCEIMKQFAEQTKTDADWSAMRETHHYGDEQIRLLWKQAAMLGENQAHMNLTPDMLSQIRAKTLIVQGDRDPFYPVDYTKRGTCANCSGFDSRIYRLFKKFL
ncbi:MAG: hypothetical protein HWD59_12310 [Coxiellaceae bacterium]|nr:MAG: hypothetical protein HWD59_12310 [Coxiellaceae bacterium]